jgi:hypothetical protein
VCDTPNCGWEKEIPHTDHYEWIDRECPECGAMLLTKKAVKSSDLLERACKVINWIIKPFYKDKKMAEALITVQAMNDGTIIEINTEIPS